MTDDRKVRNIRDKDGLAGQNLILDAIKDQLCLTNLNQAGWDTLPSCTVGGSPELIPFLLAILHDI